MAQKTVKKTTTKPAAAKKTPAKKATVKKTPAKKTASQAAAMPEMKATQMPVMDAHMCGCGQDCKCGTHCECKRGGFARFFKKLIVALILFALGFVAAKFFCCNHYGPRGPRVDFVNGCLDASTVKCPKLLAALPAMDINGDGCITREEYRAVKKEMRREIREMQVEVVDVE